MRRVCGVLAMAGVLVGVAACTDVPAKVASTPAPTKTEHSPSAPATPPPPPAPPAGNQLPRGGRVIFPKYQLVGYVGLPGSPALGPLDKDLEKKAATLEKLSRSYADGRTPQPVMELIAVVAKGSPGKDGLYRGRLADAAIDEYLTVARKHKMLLLLDIQPGRAKILPEVKRLERWLKEPDVGLAFDPEWAVGPGQVPGRVFGHTTGAELDSIASYLSGLVRANNLPEKVFVFHQLSTRIVSNEKALTKHPGVVTIKSVDGIGAPVDKLKTWGKLTAALPPSVHAGFKLFYTEDARQGPLMTPPQVLALKPRPEFVVYE
ncbi:hypothetical protein E0H73_16010 [Kribbella pittospori]|uniref:Lipoprotein n=1 Tax=Kribbella pittospori TaxID=722689 RepID=A0A4R0KPQ3_9ACTN|nr:hypothetical protein [Kribbella pittospori]TCC62210.1 hypothetical protein E0H73_16010 [Kribbella pittospori]